jgi:hypothetical protein
MDLAVKEKFQRYPDDVAAYLHQIRDLIYYVAAQENITDLTETVKWNEPSYLCKTGSTIRYDWKLNQPSQVCIFFNCKTQLVETFKELFGGLFDFSGNRAIILNINKTIPTKALAQCISMALRYKLIKDMPLLGA